MEREHYFFEYEGGQDSSRMVAGDDLGDDVILARLQAIFKGVVVVPHWVDEHHAGNPPPEVSLVLFLPSFYLQACFAHDF